ncbi:MAG: hypothetical protein KC800_24690 [Candidatus Eremiobacteraeota bacterium]|nr:hypothetical protein [Candidatus Eremiobacteraeota bacterium]
MFCPTCVRSYPEDSEKCPKCQGPLTNVIEIFADDEPPKESAPADEPPAESAAPNEPTAKVIPLTNDAPEAEEMPTEPPVAGARSPDEELQQAKAAFGSSTPDLWIASTVLCTILLLVVVFFDNSKSKPKPQPSPTSQTEQLQAQQEEPEEKVVASEEPEGPTSEELRTLADATLLKAKRSREAGDLNAAEQQAEEAYRLHSEIEDNEAEIAYSLQELALVHVEMNNLVKAKSELNQAQRLVFSSERKQILADLTGGRSRSHSAVQDSSSTTGRKRPSLGEASSVPQAAPRATQKSPGDDEKPVARRRMKEIEAYKPDEDEAQPTDVPLGQQDKVESYRGTRRGKSKIPGLR